MRLSQFPYHTLLLCVYPIVYLYAHNIVFILPENTLRSFGLSVGLTIFFLLSFRLILRSWEKAGLLCSLLVVMFFSFGHLVNLLEMQFIERQNGSISLRTLGIGWLLSFLLLVFLILRSRLPKNLTLFLNIITLVLIIFPLAMVGSTLFSVQVANSSREREKLVEMRGQAEAESGLPMLKEGQYPDIYYIVLDSYERADLLAKYYGYDNSPFLKELENRGFYVASGSRSNYLNTTYSLNTSLNLIYFGDFPKNLIKNARYNLQTNYVSDFLRERGYEVVVFDSGTGDSNNQYADVFMTSLPVDAEAESLINPFEALLMRTTVGLILVKSEIHGSPAEQSGMILADTVNHELDVRRGRIYYALNHIPDFARQEGRHFVFSHIYAPHIPFLWGPDGEELNYRENMNFYWYQPAPEDYPEQYINQVKFLNQAVLNTIDQILTESHSPVVIIIQSDHGDDRFIDWRAPTYQGIDVRSATLNAMYFSDGAYESLYPTMTTVNTFRLVFNHFFGTKYPLLSDNVYFHVHPLMTPPNVVPKFTDACQEFGVCIPKQP
jgi:hypothetical protein